MHVMEVCSIMYCKTNAFTKVEKMQERAILSSKEQNNCSTDCSREAAKYCIFVI